VAHPGSQLPIPPEASTDPQAMELMRAWRATGRLHVCLNIGVWDHLGEGQEPRAWGIALADAARHIADALAKYAGRPREETLERIKHELDAELDQPTSRRGRFVKPVGDNEE
jgi:hypothetical protein